MGAATFSYPREAGLPFGGSNYNPHIRIEIHYNNPDEVAGVIDNSGMRIKFVEKLRKFDAVSLENNFFLIMNKDVIMSIFSSGRDGTRP